MKDNYTPKTTVEKPQEFRFSELCDPRSFTPKEFSVIDETPTMDRDGVITEAEHKRLGIPVPINYWVWTHSGKQFSYNYTQPEQICIEDIAAALSKTCRYSGHLKQFFCVCPGTKVLTPEFDWVPVESVTDTIFGFDEFPTKNEHTKKVKGTRKSQVTSAKNYGLIDRECVRLKFSDGTWLDCSLEHPLLVATKSSNNQTWESAAEICRAIDSGRRRQLNRWMPSSWDIYEGRITDWERGWLAGILDGEGHLSGNTKAAPRRCLMLGFAQNDGIVLKTALSILDKLGISYNSTQSLGNDVFHVAIKGKWWKKVALLKFLNCKRLLQKLYSHASIPGMFSIQMMEQVTVVGYEVLGVKQVVALETGTHTYFTNGFGSHNSVADHCCNLVEYEESNGVDNPYYLLGVLLHDAAEAYLGDIPAPAKKLLPDFKALEKRIYGHISAKFGTPNDEEFHRHLDYIDKNIVRDEAELLFSVKPTWVKDYIFLGADIIVSKNHEQARKRYLELFWELQSRISDGTEDSQSYVGT